MEYYNTFWYKTSNKFKFTSICQQKRLVDKNKVREIKSTTLSWEHDVSLPRRSKIVINRLRIEYTSHTHEH